MKDALRGAGSFRRRGLRGRRPYRKFSNETWLIWSTIL
jgi:hypothetical protein